MMSYQIRITKSAEQDITDTVDYIDEILLNPLASDNLLNHIEEAFSKLKVNPHLYPIADDPVLKGFKIRIIPINNYIAFYTIDEVSKTVFLVRFLYSKRQWAEILTQDFHPPFI